MTTLEVRPTTTRSAIAVVIATHNRAHLVAHAVYSIYRQQWTTPFELILVDAASHDGTLARLQELAAQAPPHIDVQVLDDYTGSASCARNVGWRAATAPIIAFLDDDAEAEPNWIERALEQFTFNPRISVLAGRTDIRWLGDAPSDVLTDSAALFTTLDYGRRMKRIHYPRAPIGPNMLVRQEALQECGGFDPELGPAPGRGTVGEEGDLSLRIERSGGQVFYDPTLEVHHLLDGERMTPEYVLERARIHGHSRCLVDLKHFGWRRLPHQIVRLLRGVFRVAIRHRYTVLEKIDFAYGAAYLKTLLRAHRH